MVEMLVVLRAALMVEKMAAWMVVLMVVMLVVLRVASKVEKTVALMVVLE
jgi:hypothetical protein